MLLRPLVLTAVPEVVVLRLSMIVSLLADLVEPDELTPETELALLELPDIGIVPDCLESNDD